MEPLYVTIVVVAVTIIVSVFLLRLAFLAKSRGDEILKLKNKNAVDEKCYQNKLHAVRAELDERVRITECENEHLQAENDKFRFTLKELESNTTAIPYMAGMIADMETY